MRLALVLALIVSLSPALAADPLRVVLKGVGGLSPRGVGHTEERVEEGAVAWYDMMADETLPNAGQPGNPKGADGWTRKKLNDADLARVDAAVAATDFESVKLDASVTPPSASDGMDRTLEVTAGGKTHTVKLWQVTSPKSFPVIDLLGELRKTYAK